MIHSGRSSPVLRMFCSEACNGSALALFVIVLIGRTKLDKITGKNIVTGNIMFEIQVTQC